MLLPGGLFARDADCIITTVLGSCVAVCLWDPQRRRGGMNHYKLPLWNGDGLPSPKFGNIATCKLLELMLEMHCHQESLQAKIFGGAAVFQNACNLLNVGQRNIDIARKVLAEHNIPIVASDVGGSCSRKLKFNTTEGSVLVRKSTS
ncbi:MAG: chemotaxis protein CheD [Magnetococcales bacterium]|nr:chemotaxis protein CheD [Magnetococcales bacterium]